MEADFSVGSLLTPSFFERPTAEVARDLLGCIVVSEIGGVLTGGRIVETEAYLGSDDPGSHAATRGVTKRNSVMYGEPGTAYVYFTYGAHHMLNLVCESHGTAGAVLLRAIEPMLGVEQMSARREGRGIHELANGPGKLCAALGVELLDNGTRLGEGRIAVYDGARPGAAQVCVSGRVGLSAGHELELRYFVADSRFVSRGRTGPPRVAGKASARARRIRKESP